MRSVIQPPAESHCLESSNPRNLSFYHPYAFDDYGVAVVLEWLGPVLQPMWRPGAARR